MTELLPCPFCGGPARMRARVREESSGVYPHVVWQVTCDDEDCAGYLPYTTYSRKTEAAAAWNRRAVPQGANREQIVAALIAKSMLNTIEATQLQAEQQADAILALSRPK